MIAGAVAGALAFGLTGAVVIPAAGFTEAGIAAGSAAAAAQTPATAAGGAFATAQSIGATGKAAATGAKVGGGIGALIGALVHHNSACHGVVYGEKLGAMLPF